MPKFIKVDLGLIKLLQKYHGSVFLTHMIQISTICRLPVLSLLLLTQNTKTQQVSLDATLLKYIPTLQHSHISTHDLDH